MKIAAQTTIPIHGETSCWSIGSGQIGAYTGGMDCLYFILALRAVAAVMNATAKVIRACVVLLRFMGRSKKNLAVA